MSTPIVAKISIINPDVQRRGCCLYATDFLCDLVQMEASKEAGGTWEPLGYYCPACGAYVRVDLSTWTVEYIIRP